MIKAAQPPQAEPTHGRHWFGDRSITTKLAAIVVIFVTIIGLLLVLFGGAMGVLTGVRAYVRGEGLWTRHQKDATYYLARYADTRDPEDLQAYRDAIAVPLGDRQARLELEKHDFDYDVARRGFLQGENDPRDIPYMIYLFRWFRDVAYFDRAITIWAEADQHIDRLIATGEDLRRAIESGDLSPARRTALLTRLDKINRTLTPLEDEFSATLGKAARWTRDVLLASILSLALLLLTGGLWISWHISSGVRHGILNLKRGARRVAEGDLDHEIPVISGDELGELAGDFNDMIGHRRQAAQTLEREREFLSAVLDSLAEGVVACDENGRLMLFNRTAREIHGREEQPLLADEWAERYDLYLPDGHTPMPTEQVPLYRSYQGEIVADVEMVIAPDNRPARVMLVNGRPIVTVSGRKLGAVAVLHDITERKRAEHQLFEHAQELARSNAELEQFAYVASHDLQEPLRTISIYTQLLAKRFEDTAETADLVGYITEAVERMQHQIRGLLDYSRVDQQDEAVENADLSQLLDRALANLEDAVERNAATVTRDALPRLRVAPSLIVQVFQNLIANALKFRGDLPPLIHVGAERGDGEWMISVRDNGIGLEPQHTERIFRLYQRLHTRDRYPGSGLGLTICRKIVERHGGRIWAEPAEQGTVIRFTLPES